MVHNATNIRSDLSGSGNLAMEKPRCLDDHELRFCVTMCVADQPSATNEFSNRILTTRPDASGRVVCVRDCRKKQDQPLMLFIQNNNHHDYND